MSRIFEQIVVVMEAKKNYILLSLILVVIFGGTIYSLYLGNNLRYGDEHDYYLLAKNFILKHSFTLDGENPTGSRPPGYPFFLSFFLLLGSDIIFLRIVNFILLGCCIYLLYILLKNQSTPVTGLLGAILVICYPILFYASGALLAQNLASFLFLLIIFLLTKNKPSIEVFFLSGLFFGYLILTVPTFIFILFVFPLWFWFSNDRIMMKRFLITIITAVLLIGIWSVRNYTVFKTFVFCATNGGYNLLQGNSPYTTPENAGVMDVSEKYVVPSGLNEAQRDAFYKSKAIEFILNNKLKTIKLYFLKLLYHFHYTNEHTTKMEPFIAKAKDGVMLLTYGALLLLFFFRILFLKRFPLSNFELLLIMLYISNAFFSAIFFTRIRFRLPFDYILIAIAAMFTYHLIESKRSKSFMDASKPVMTGSKKWIKETILF